MGGRGGGGGLGIQTLQAKLLKEGKLEVPDAEDLEQ